MRVRLRGSSVSFFLPISKSVFISSTVAPTPPLRKRRLPIDTCHRSPVGLASLLCSSSHNFFFLSLFPLLFFFLFTCSLTAPGGGIIFRRRFISQHPIDSSLSSPSLFQVLLPPVTLLDSVTFSENQSLPTPFRI